jgi:hypothetical protein
MRPINLGTGRENVVVERKVSAYLDKCSSQKFPKALEGEEEQNQTDDE